VIPSHRCAEHYDQWEVRAVRAAAKHLTHSPEPGPFQFYLAALPIGVCAPRARKTTCGLRKATNRYPHPCTEL
jgi:hypothetical protein